MKTIIKWLLASLATMVVALALVLALLPTIVSTQVLNPLLFSLSASVMNGSLHATEIRASWLSGIELRDATLKDPSGETVIQAASIAYDSSLFSLILDPFSQGKIKVNAPFVQVTNDKGVLALDALLHPADATTCPPNISLSNLHLAFDLSKGKNADIKLSFDVTSPNQPAGTITIDAQAEDLFSLKEGLADALSGTHKATKAFASSHITISQLPTSIIDAALHSINPDATNLASTAIGPNITAEVVQTLKDNALHFNTHIQSDKLKADFDLQVANGVVSLPKEAIALYTLTPEAFQTVTRTLRDERLQAMALKQPIQFRCNLSETEANELSFSLSHTGLIELQKESWPDAAHAQFEAKGVYSGKTQGLTGSFTSTAGFAERDFTTSAEVTLESLFDTKKQKSSVHIQTAIDPELLSTLFPANPITSKETVKCSLDAQAQNGALNAKIALSPLTIDKTTLQDTTVTVTQKNGAPLQISAQSDVAHTGAFKATTKARLQSQGTDKAYLELENLELMHGDTPLGVYQLQAPIQYSLESKNLLATLTLLSDNRPIIEAHFDASLSESTNTELLPFGLVANLSANFTALPSSLATPVVPAIEKLVGPTLSGKLQLQIDSNLPKPLEQALLLHGEDFDLNISFFFGKELSGKKPLGLSWKITPERFTILREMLSKQNERQKELLLQQPVLFTLKIADLSLPLLDVLQSKASLIDSLSAKAHITTEMMNFELIEKKKDGQRFQFALAPLEAAGLLSAKKQGISFHVETDKQAKNGAQISVSGEADHLWDSNGFDPTQADIKLNAEIKELPLDMFQGLISDEETADRIVDTLGKSANVTIQGQVHELDSGTFDATFFTSHLQSHIYCSLDDGTITLKRPLEAFYTLTADAGRALLKDINPLLATAARSQKPITLKIDPAGFSIPLKEFCLKEIKIKTMQIDPGILYAKNSGMLSLLTSFLKIKNTKDSDLSLWFTPIYIEMEKGIIECKRADVLLSDSFPLATWGSIDLVKNKVNMILGLSGQALGHAFDLKRMDPNSLIQIPIKGSTQSPRFDTARATAKITALKLQEHKNTAGLIGGLLGIAATAGDKEQAPPQPTTHPFPWQQT